MSVIDEERVKRLEIHAAETVKDLENMGSELTEILAVVQAILQTDSQSTDVPQMEMLDKLLVCSRCKRRLAVFNPETEEVRFKYKDHYLYFNAGKGGHLKILCRGCGHLNPINDESEDDDGASER